MILDNSFTILFLINYLQMAVQERHQIINNRPTNNFQKYGNDIKVLETYNNSIYFDNMIHGDANNYSMEIETAFKNTIAMHGVQYIYKRGFYWRTWRHATKANHIIFFKSQSISPINCTICHAGFWVIEEKRPLCQYEILALQNNEDVCVFTPNNISNNKCSKVMSLRDLIRECGNPIRTEIRITYKYTDVSERNTVICQGREFCEITTLYSIYHDFIVFQIINSTDKVIYSRIMMDGYRNFVYTNNYDKMDSIKENKNIKLKKFDNKQNKNTGCLNISKKNQEKLFFRNVLNYKVYNTIGGKNLQILHETEAKLTPCKKLQLMQIINEDSGDDAL